MEESCNKMIIKEKRRESSCVTSLTGKCITGIKLWKITLGWPILPGWLGSCLV